MSIYDFSIVGKLGEGSFSSVYKVLRKSDETFYALKRVKLKELKPKEQKNAFTEIQVLASLDHANIISYKESFLDPNTSSLCIVMEFAENGDLLSQIHDREISKSYFQEEELWEILKQALLGLHALHSLNILHRDIKSANILVTADNTYKLGDLNICKTKGKARSKAGTPYYCSPEVWKGACYNTKSDIWSLGVTLYQLASLELPFRGLSCKELYQNVLTGNYRPIPSFYSEDLCNVIKKMLFKQPNLRPSCYELLQSEEIKGRTCILFKQLSLKNRLIGDIQTNNMRFPEPRYLKRTASVDYEQVEKENIPENTFFGEEAMTPSPAVNLFNRKLPTRRISLYGKKKRLTLFKKV